MKLDRRGFLFSLPAAVVAAKAAPAAALEPEAPLGSVVEYLQPWDLSGGGVWGLVIPDPGPVLPGFSRASHVHGLNLQMRPR